MRTCSVCTTEFENFTDHKEEHCSGPCKITGELREELTRVVMTTRPTEDTRIFFYPLSFGSLVDRYSIISIRRAMTKSVKRQQELDYQLFKLRKSIQTHLGQIYYDEVGRQDLSKLVTRLFASNAKIWLLTDLAMNRKMDLEISKQAWWSTIKFRETRVKTIRQLDMLVHGKTTEYRVYAGEDS